MPNRLAQETSPYLLQHAGNPVDWQPWDQQALQQAQREGKPIFLSIGYSACHWCHVMEHESFENQQIAARLNEHFVCIKVDREERPDLDQIYMQAVLKLTGRGGWPMSVFLKPDLKPFFGGTYWPPQARMGLPGFDQVIQAVHDFWVNRREELDRQADVLTRHLQADPLSEGPDSSGDAGGGLNEELLRHAEANLERTFDGMHGGFGGAPKFPHPMDLRLLMRLWRRWPREGVMEMVQLTLDKMGQGGIYDHLGGGFARYSVDARWLVPHFEKMLYDNGLLADVYLEGYLASGKEHYATIVGETLDYILREMTDEAGGFYSSQDADSEGEEGKFYVWTPDEIEEVLGSEKAQRFCRVYDVSPDGNFEGQNILNLPKTLEQCAALYGWGLAELTADLAESRSKLLEVRNRRIPPGKDDKVLVSWNALVIGPLARAAGVFDEPRYLQAAQRAALFILEHMRREDGRLLHTWRNGRAHLDAYLDDYAYLIDALITLYEADFDERWIDQAVELAEIVLRHFADPEGDGFFFTADDHETLIARQKDRQDASVPSGNSMAATALVRLGKLCGRDDFLQAMEKTLRSAVPFMQRAPAACGQMLIAVDSLLGPLPEIVVMGDVKHEGTAEVLSSLRRRFLPNRLIACRGKTPDENASPHLEPLFSGKATEDESPTVYVCQNFACQAPVSGNAAVMEMWNELAAPASDI